jgi:hypothetical protein
MLSLYIVYTDIIRRHRKIGAYFFYFTILYFDSAIFNHLAIAYMYRVPSSNS